MALNKIRLLDEEQLLKAIREGGYEDIANTLTNRGINGQSFLHFQEFQTISWRLPRAQIKNLTDFISQVNANPAILIKAGGIAPRPLHKPKPSIPPTSKPNLPITKPNLPITKPKPAPPKPTFASATSENFDSTLPVSETKAPPKSYGITNNTVQSDFKKKLGLIIGGGAESSSTTPSPNLPETKPKYPKPLPPSEPNQTFDRTSKNVRPLPTEPMDRSNVNPNVFNKPLPTEPAETGAKRKVSKPLKTEPNNPNSKPIGERPALPLPREIESNRESVGSQKSFTDIDPQIDYGYLSPNDVSNSYPINVTQVSSRQPVAHNKSTFLHSKSTNSLPLPSHDTEHENSEDTYEAPPNIRSSPRSRRESLPLPPPASEDQNSRISPKSNRKLLPVPNEVLGAPKKEPHFPRQADLNSKRSSSGNNLNPNEDEEMNIYDHVDEVQKIKNANSRGYVNVEAPTKQKTDINNQQPLQSSTQKRKCAVNDLENVIIVERENQSKRTNNFLESLGSIGKFLVDKCKPVKGETTDSSNYENHMLQSEVPAIQTPLFSIKERPLPEIPKSGSPIPTVRKSSSFNETRSVSKYEKSNQNISKSSSFNKVEDRGFKRSSGRKVEVSNDFINRPLPEIVDDDDEHGLVYENLQDKKTRDDTDESDMPEYENNETLSASPKYDVKRQRSPTKSILPDELAFKLNEALTAREKNKKSESKTSSMNRPGKNNFSKIPTPPGSDAEDDQPFYENFDRTEDRSSLTRNNVNVNTPSDDADEETEPFHEMVDEADQAELDEEADEPPSDEEQEEYIDSIFNINHEPFYRNTDRKGAKELLRNLTEGAFLFRPSQKYFLVLTIKFNKKFYNLGIERTPNNKIRLNADTSSVSPEFGTLRSFVDYFTKEAVTFRAHDDLVEIFLNPVLPADVF